MTAIVTADIQRKKFSADHRRKLRLSHLGSFSHVDDIPGEQWKIIPGWPTFRASNLGRIAEGDILRVGLAPTRRYIRLTDLSRSQVYSIAGLVLLAFVGPPSDKKNGLARHLDDNPSRNSLDNLAWGSKSDNAWDAIRNGKQVYSAERGEKISKAKKGKPATVPVWNQGIKLPEGHPLLIAARAANVGKRWITDGTVERKINAKEKLPSGWIWGRL